MKSIPCPKCGHQKSDVKDGRMCKLKNHYRRRHLCQQCKHRYTTFERLEFIEPSDPKPCAIDLLRTTISLLQGKINVPTKQITP